MLGASVCVITGGAGYGKSALAAESRDRLEVAAVSTVLEPGGVPAALLPHRLRSAAARVGLSDLAAHMDAAAADLGVHPPPALLELEQQMRRRMLAV